MRALWLVNRLWFIEPVNSWKIVRLLNYYIKAKDHKFLWFRGMINHLGCWNNTQRIHVLPTSRTVYQPINHTNLWSCLIIPCSINMVSTNVTLQVFLFLLHFSIFWGVLNKTITPIVVVGDGMIIANSEQCALLVIFHLKSKMCSWNNCSIFLLRSSTTFKV